MKRYFLAAVLLLLPTISNASTMTFERGTHEEIQVCNPWCSQVFRFREDGITGIGNESLPEDTGLPNQEYVQLNNQTSPLASLIDFTMAGRFDAVRFDLGHNSWGYADGGPGDPIKILPYLNVELTGYRGSTLVAQSIFMMEDTTVEFGSIFSNLTRLRIKALTPAGLYCSNSCSEFSVDNVTLAAVPLPASLPLLLAGIASLGFWRRKKA